MAGFDPEQLDYLEANIRKPLTTLTRGFDTLAEHRLHVDEELKNHDGRIKGQGEALQDHAEACPVVRRHSIFVSAAIGAAAVGLVGIFGTLLWKAIAGG